MPVRSEVDAPSIGRVPDLGVGALVPELIGVPAKGAGGDDVGVGAPVSAGVPGPVSPPAGLAPTLGEVEVGVGVGVPAPVLPLGAEPGDGEPDGTVRWVVLGLAPLVPDQADVLDPGALPFDQEDDVGLCAWLPLLRNRTASMPSANAPLANTIGCRRANASTSVTMSFAFRWLRYVPKRSI